MTDLSSTDVLPNHSRLGVNIGGLLSAFPLFIALFSIFGPFLTDTVYVYSGVGFDLRSRVFTHGYPTIDPNVGATSFALGARAALDVLSGHLPLWNHYEGLGTPLLGEMQSAALFPPTWLLALPHGQAIEQALLQLVAGVGAFLFFRKFGLGITAALAGSLVFEVNGVFAWLRNAIYNPVAFLPWLFFVVEDLRACAMAKCALQQRAPIICLGAGMAALALYAGFPEEVYLYAILLIAWVIFRMAGLSVRQNLTFIRDLLLTSLIALALCAPILVAFAAFLGEAALAGHSDNGFYGIWLNSSAIIQYVMPYVFGQIFASNNQTLDRVWGDTGGYIGFVPIVFALAGLFIPHRRAVKIFLVGWVIIALGVTHGMPGVYSAFMTLPLVKVAACYRYLNPSWIFCIIFLAALFIDSIPTLPQPALRRILGWALACGLISITIAAVAAWPLIPELWADSHLYHSRAFMVGSLMSVAFLSLCILRAARCGTAGTAMVMSCILAAEAMVWFLLPYLSTPRHGRVDDDLIAYLRANIGYQRVIGTTEASLNPNWGSYFGIPLLNYDDIPAPKLTAKYVKETLDPYANPNVFVQSWGNISPEQLLDRKKIFRERLSRYAQAGVKYVLAGPDFNSNTAFHILPIGAYPYRLAAGQRVEISAQTESTAPFTVTSVSLPVETYFNTSNGHLMATFCADTTCAEGLADLGLAGDNNTLRIALDHSVRAEAGMGYTVRIEKLDGDKDVAVWMFPLASMDTTTKIVGTPAAVKDGYLPDLRLTSDSDLKLVHRGRTMSIYELPDTRPYFSADSCALKPFSHDRVDAWCTHPSKLTRLEVAMRGWSATVNGHLLPIGLSDGVFQTIDLPAGKAHVEFTYEPLPGFKPALAVAGAALLLLFTVFAGSIRGAHAPHPRASVL